MPYVEAITEAGQTVEIERYYTSRYNRKNETRRARSRPTPEEMQRVNTKHAEKKLRRLMNANFGCNDFHVVLPYIHHPGEDYRTREEMKADIARFLRQIRKAYRRNGKELKYIHVMEIGSRGSRHHHLVINNIDVAAVMAAWPYARAQIFPLDDSGQYGKLAAYFIKYSSTHLKDDTEAKLQGKRWNCSRNLIRPQTKIKIISNRSWFRTEAKVPSKYAKEYYLDKESVSCGVSSEEYFGYGYLRFTLIRLRC